MPKRKTNGLAILSCRLPPALHERFKRLAARDRRTQSSYLRLLLEDAINEREKSKRRIA